MDNSPSSESQDTEEVPGADGRPGAIKRQFLRLNCQVPAEVQLTDSEGRVSRHAAEVCDVSTSGVGLIVRELPEGSLESSSVWMRVRRNGGYADTDMEGAVVYGTVVTHDSSRVGICFDRIRVELGRSVSTWIGATVRIDVRPSIPDTGAGVSGPRGLRASVPSASSPGPAADSGLLARLARLARSQRR